MSNYGISVCKTGYYYDLLVSLENNVVLSCEVGAILSGLCNLNEEQILEELESNYEGKDDLFNEENVGSFLNWMENELKANMNVGDILASFLTIEIADMSHSFLYENGSGIIDFLRDEAVGMDAWYSLRRDYSPVNNKFEMSFERMNEFIFCAFNFLISTISMARSMLSSYSNDEENNYFEIFDVFFRAQSFEYRIGWFKQGIMPIYKMNNLTALVAFELNSLIELGLNVKECEHCRRFFVPLKKSDEKYCSGMSKIYPTLTCKEAAKRIKQQENLKNSESDRLRRIVYNTLRNKLVSKKAEDDTVYNEYEKILHKFSADASEWRKKVISGITSEEEYINWLKSFQKHNK